MCSFYWHGGPVSSGHLRVYVRRNYGVAGFAKTNITYTNDSADRGLTAVSVIFAETIPRLLKISRIS